MHPKLQDPAAGPPGEQLGKVERSLERVLASPAFRNSRQCQKFLRHVIENSFHGRDEMLHERTIGVEVFGRAPDYDTGEDPVVRVRATEVRKRLAQCYQDFPAEDEVRFEIPAGSYRAEFHWCAAKPEPPASAPATPGESRRRRPMALAATAVGTLALAALAGLFFLRRSAPGLVEQFWAPVLESPKPVLIYCGQPVVYFLSKEVHDRYRESVPADRQRGSYAVPLDPNAALRGRDIIPVTDQFVGIGNAHTAALLSGLFAARHKPVEIRYANDLSFSDLRSSPSVLVGAFSNFWTLEMTGELRFVFEQDKEGRRIRDRAVENRTWRLRGIAPDGKTSEDYAIVSRLFHSASGQLILSAAGITQYGTRAAGEFVTDPARLSEALSNAPKDWPRRNLQVLLHTTVFKGTPAPPRVLEKHFW